MAIKPSETTDEESFAPALTPIAMGDTVLYTVSMSMPDAGEPGSVWPATVLRVLEPENPKGKLTLTVYTELGPKTAQQVPHEPEAKDGKAPDPNGSWHRRP